MNNSIGEFIQNPRWELEVLREPQAVAVVTTTGKAVQRAIFENLPTGHGGHYAASFVAGSSVEPAFAPDGTAALHITMGDPRWHIIEFGDAKYTGVHNPPYAPVRKGVLTIGLDWVKE